MSHSKGIGIPELEPSIQSNCCIFEVQQRSEMALREAAQCADPKIPDNATVWVHAYWPLNEEEMSLFSQIQADSRAVSGFQMSDLESAVVEAGGNTEQAVIRLSLVVQYERKNDHWTDIITKGFPLGRVKLCFLEDIVDTDFYCTEADGENSPGSGVISLNTRLVEHLAGELSVAFRSNEFLVAVCSTEPDNNPMVSEETNRGL